MNKSLHILISGGGTGGHIFPAIAIAEALKQKHPDCNILFVGARGKMEMTKVPEAGYVIKGLWISGLQRKLSLSNLLFPIKVLSSIVQAVFIIKQFKPNVAIGVGGYASAPALRAANILGIPTLIQEQNSYAGKANVWLSKKANTICVAYKNMQKYFPKEKIVFTGNPIRKILCMPLPDANIAKQYFQLVENKKTIVVLGGSLGAGTINKSIAKFLNYKPEDVQLIWQTGAAYINEYTYLHNKEKGIIVSAFIKEMNMAYAAADIIISRSGAISISELSVVAKPCILVPSPNVAEDHQTKNAKALTDENAAIAISDIEAESKLTNAILELLNDNSKQISLKENLKKLGINNATERIVEEIEKCIQ